MVHHVRQERGEVVAAKMQEQAAEREGWEGFQEVKGDEAGEVAACRLGGISTEMLAFNKREDEVIRRKGEEGATYFTTSKHQLATKNLRTVLHQPFCGVVAVFCAGGPGVFGCKTVSDRDYGYFEVVGHVLEIRILTTQPSAFHLHLISIHSPHIFLLSIHYPLTLKRDTMRKD
jgi:hypothetical protein